MRQKLKEILSKTLLIVCVSTSLYSCRKVFDIKPEGELDETETYRNVYDADAAVTGIYGKLLNLSKQYVVLNELRADLMDVTANADKDLQDISTHSVTEGNQYASARPFYEVILNCNDVLKHFNQMLKEKRFTQTEYNQRYSDILALRSWLYLQLGIHFGSVPYVTDALEDASALKNTDNFPRITFNALLDTLTATVEKLPTLDVYPESSSLVTTVDNFYTQKFFINKQVFLGDLYLWKGEYRKAATAYKAVMESESNSSNADRRVDFYKVIYADVANNNDIAVGYLRYREQDINTLINSTSQGWKSIFARSQDELWNSEWLWSLPYSSSFEPGNPFVELFLNYGAGKYLLKPSQTALNNWSSQVQRNGFPFDARGLFTVSTVNNQPVIAKYTYGYSSLKPLEKPGNWFLYRAALLHLRYSEAANRDGQGKVAWALLNKGISSTFDTDPANTNQTNKQATFLPPPYDFDARKGDIPYFRDSWHKNGGIRGRAYLNYLDESLQTNTLELENKLIDEAALELAYEGNRWPDLLRIALRRNDPSYLADKVADKLLKDGNPAAETVRQKLLKKDNWYLPLKLD